MYPLDVSFKGKVQSESQQVPLVDTAIKSIG